MQILGFGLKRRKLIGQRKEQKPPKPEKI